MTRKGPNLVASLSFEGVQAIALPCGCIRSDSESPDARWLIWSHEHGAWWRPHSRGYTTAVAEAGRYTEEAARKICADTVYGWRDGQPTEVMVPASSPDLDTAVQKATDEAIAGRERQP